MTNCARGLINRLVRTQLPVVFFRPRGVAADVFCIPVTTRRGQRGDLEAASGLRAEGPHLRLHSVSVKAIANALLCLSPPPPPSPAVCSLAFSRRRCRRRHRASSTQIFLLSPRLPRAGSLETPSGTMALSPPPRCSIVRQRFSASPAALLLPRSPCFLLLLSLIIRISLNASVNSKRYLRLLFFFLRQRTKECQRATRWCTAARLLTQNLVLRWRRVRNFSFVEI